MRPLLPCFTLLLLAITAPAVDLPTSLASPPTIGTDLHVSADGHRLERDDKSAFFLLSDTQWMLNGFSDAHIAQILDDRKAKGFTAVQVWASRTFWPVERRPDFYGQQPFLNGTATQLNPAYWNRWRTICDMAAARGLHFILVMGDPGIKGPDKPYFIGTKERAYEYARQVGAIFATAPHIIFAQGEDCASDSVDTIMVDGWRAMAEGTADGVNGVNAYDGQANYDTTMQTFHGYNISSSFHDDKWIDFYGPEVWHDNSQVYNRMRDDWILSQPIKPVFLMEGSYEKEDWITADYARAEAWFSVLGSCQGYGYGHYDNYTQRTSVDFLQSPGARQMQVLATFIATSKWMNWSPDVTMVDNPGGGSSRVVAVRSQVGDEAVAYFPLNTGKAVHLDRITGTDTVAGMWLDLRNGQTTPAGTWAAGTTPIITPPSSWQDAVLTLTRGNGNRSPSVTLTSPVNATKLAPPATITLSADASDSDGAVAKVEFFQGTTKLGEDTTAPYSFTWTNVAAGSYSLTAKATDNLGATTTATAVTVSVAATGIVGTGTGLTGSYWRDQMGTFNGPATLERTDAAINFDWGTGAPGATMSADRFTVRWAGQLQASFSEAYTFSTTSDDGVRLWLNGQQVINNWTDHAPTDNSSAAIVLTAGQKVDVVMEYYDNGGGAVAKLAWASASTPRQIVPTSQLHPLSQPPVAGAFGVNINGGALTVDCVRWRSASEAQASGLSITNASTWSGTYQAALSPSADADATAMLQSLVYRPQIANGQGVSISQQVTNGTYDVWVWMVENYQSNFRDVDLQLENQPVATAIGDLPLWSWRKYGPYRAAVTDGVLNLDLLRHSKGDPAIAGLYIAPVGGSPAAAVPAPWSTADIGSVGTAGSAALAGAAWTVTGSGADIWNTSDAFRFVSQPLNGDGEITARVVSQTNSDTWAKAGVMIRESSASGSRHAMVVVTPGQGVSFQRRLNPDADSSATAGAWARAPYWVRLGRVGSTFSAWQSVDGVTWVLVDRATIAIGANARIGLTVTSHNNSATSTAVFDQVTVRLAPNGNG
jgi:regulation of enolase protein 1 (concanavalin A-like superfamily)